MADGETRRDWPPFLFDSAAVRDIKESAFKILAETGVKYESRRARDILVRAGAKEEADGSVRIPTEMVRACLTAAPASFRLHNIHGTPDVELGSGRSYFTPGRAALFVLSPDGKSVREAVANDIVRTTKLVEEGKLFSVAGHEPPGPQPLAGGRGRGIAGKSGGYGGTLDRQTAR